jgi:hypothetical protein
MAETDVLAKTTRINLLFDFYRPLLTEKQQTFMQLHFHEDFSLGEIAEQFDVSRQAVFEHIKRAEQMLEEYEDKLQLLRQHEERSRAVRECIELIRSAAMPEKARVLQLLHQIGGDPDGV